ncbi:MAG: hypothetical protein HYS51_00320 [Candidatus Zambryskibacteria bacterium]|nr:hypothetical protein [Candidatus Zambryskibacteria bacterium]
MNLSEMIWQRGSAWQVMHEARKRFLDEIARGQILAPYVALASVHYSLVKRYMEQW